MSGPGVRVTVNGEPVLLDASPTVAAVVEDLGCGTAGVAVAVNDEVVPRSRWAARELRAGDRVEVLNAAQGG